MPRLFLIACLGLAACGADGPPEPPASKGGISLTGEVATGVVIR
jgi:hypothetical protein